MHIGVSSTGVNGVTCVIKPHELYLSFLYSGVIWLDGHSKSSKFNSHAVFLNVHVILIQGIPNPYLPYLRALAITGSHYLYYLIFNKEL